MIYWTKNFNFLTNFSKLAPPLASRRLKLLSASAQPNLLSPASYQVE
jgi:hypothetical protein